MAETRRCGYCRSEGHTMPKCEVKRDQRRKIVLHTIAERKRFVEMLLERGMGNGAMIRATNVWNRREPVLGMILSIEDMVRETYFAVHKKQKRSKRVLTTYHTFDPEHARRDPGLVYSTWTTLRFKFLDTGNTIMRNWPIDSGDILAQSNLRNSPIEVLDPTTDFPEDFRWDDNIQTPNGLANYDFENFLTLNNT